MCLFYVIFNFYYEGEEDIKFKKWLLALAAFTAMIVVCAIGAGAKTYGDFAYKLIPNDGTVTVEITKYNGRAEKVVIPAKINGKSVTSIGNFAFDKCTSLKSVAIPSSVKSIGNYAFYRCTSLKSVTIPSSLICMGYESFGQCSNLTAINVAAGNKIYTSVSGVLFNKEKTELVCYPVGKKDKSYTIPVGVTSIRDYAFSNCENLTKITIPNSTKSIGQFAFYCCFNIKSVTIPNGVTSMDYGAFMNCFSLTTIAIPNSMKSISNNAFGYCTKLKSVTIPNGVTRISNNAFNGCISLTKITIPASITYIGNSAFKECSSLTSVTIPASVSDIGSTAFGYYYDNNKISNFKIYCYSGTAGEKYAKGNGFEYELLGTKKQLAKVGNFKVKSKSSTSVTLQWNKNANASGYEIQQYKDKKWTTIATVGSNSTVTYTVKGLKAGTAGYQFRIRAYKTYGDTKQYGSWSSEVKVNTNPYGVGGFKVKSTAKTSITLGWNKGTTASGYELQQYKNGKWVTITTPNKASTVSYTVKGLKANTSYNFRIRAYKTYGNTKQYGSWSNTLTVKTKK